MMHEIPIMDFRGADRITTRALRACSVVDDGTFCRAPIGQTFGS